LPQRNLYTEHSGYRIRYLTLIGTRDSALRTFPVELLTLTHLETLRLERHAFTEVPYELGERLVELQYLDLTGCTQLKRLPLSIASMPDLIYVVTTGSQVRLNCLLPERIDCFRRRLRARFSREPRAAIEAVMLARLRDGNPWRSVPRDVARIIGALLMRSAGEAVWHREAPDPDRPAVRRLRKRVKR
jgi:hypothetical protein